MKIKIRGIESEKNKKIKYFKKAVISVITI